VLGLLSLTISCRAATTRPSTPRLVVEGAESAKGAMAGPNWEHGRASDQGPRWWATARTNRKALASVVGSVSCRHQPDPGLHPSDVEEVVGDLTRSETKVGHALLGRGVGGDRGDGGHPGRPRPPGPPDDTPEHPTGPPTRASTGSAGAVTRRPSCHDARRHGEPIGSFDRALNEGAPPRFCTDRRRRGRPGPGHLGRWDARGCKAAGAALSGRRGRSRTRISGGERPPSWASGEGPRTPSRRLRPLEKRGRWASLNGSYRGWSATSLGAPTAPREGIITSLLSSRGRVDMSAFTRRPSAQHEPSSRPLPDRPGVSDGRHIACAGRHIPSLTATAAVVSPSSQTRLNPPECSP
jgi:hypothetical protein